MEMISLSKILIFALKIMVAGMSAYLTGTLLDWQLVGIVVSAFVGLLGVKSFELILASFGY